MSVGFENDGRPGEAPRPGMAGAQGDWDTLKDGVTEMAGAAVERGRTFVDSAKAQATEYVDRRKDDAAQSVADFASSLRETRRAFEDRPNLAAFFDSATEGLDQLSETIRERSFAEMFNEVEVAMRRRPTLVAAASLTAGFMFARFVKASAEGMRDHRQQEAFARSRGSGPRMPPPYGGQGERNRDFRGQDV